MCEKSSCRLKVSAWAVVLSCVSVNNIIVRPTFRSSSTSRQHGFVHSSIHTLHDQVKESFNSFTNIVTCGSTSFQILQAKKERKRIKLSFVDFNFNKCLKLLTDPCCSATSLARYSLMTLLSSRSHLLPHNTTSGWSQYAWVWKKKLVQ